MNIVYKLITLTIDQKKNEAENDEKTKVFMISAVLKHFLRMNLHQGFVKFNVIFKHAWPKFFPNLV